MMTQRLIRGMGLAVALACLPGAVRAAGRPVDGYAAVVNDRVITIGDVMEFIGPVEEQLRDTYMGGELREKLDQAYISGRDALIEKALILEESEALEGVLPERAIEDHTNMIIHERFNDDRAAFLAGLAREQITLSDWGEQVKELLVVMTLRRQMVMNHVVVPPGGVREAYEKNIEAYRVPDQVKLHAIALNKGVTEEDQAVKRQEAERVLHRLRGGEDFGAVAREVSEGSKAAEGGDWGWIHPGDLKSELAEVASALQPGETSGIVAAGDELYIMRVEGRREAVLKPFEEVRDGIEKELREAEEERLYKAWIERLMKKHYVKILDEQND